MIERFEDYDRLFAEINKLAKKKIKIYVIGGAVLLFRKLKAATKDIDIVVNDREDYDELNNALKDLGYKLDARSKAYRHFNLGCILKKGKSQIDIFQKRVCSKFSFSEAMIQRSENNLLLDKIEVYFCSNEDVFSFKTMTDRQGDIDDCIALAKRTLDWKIIINEIKDQIHASGEDIWITWINERLELLQERGIVIPIIKETQKLTMEYYKGLEKKAGI